MANKNELKKAIWEVIQENDWMLVTNQNIDWLIEQAYKKLGAE